MPRLCAIVCLSLGLLVCARQAQASAIQEAARQTIGPQAMEQLVDEQQYDTFAERAFSEAAAAYPPFLTEPEENFIIEEFYRALERRAERCAVIVPLAQQHAKTQQATLARNFAFFLGKATPDQAGIWKLRHGEWLERQKNIARTIAENDAWMDDCSTGDGQREPGASLFVAISSGYRAAWYAAHQPGDKIAQNDFAGVYMAFGHPAGEGFVHITRQGALYSMVSESISSPNFRGVFSCTMAALGTATRGKGRFFTWDSEETLRELRLVRGLEQGWPVLDVRAEPYGNYGTCGTRGYFHERYFKVSP